ncbi:MAG: NUDIX domain-containing protein [Clostridia bacterium]|nr:NUDIX domain-containing protein [Clostridia bacterium]
MDREYAYNAVVVFCYIVKENKVLLIKRNMPPEENKYTVVGGKKERGEDLVAACKREVYEETSLILKTVRFRGAINFIIEESDVETVAFYFESEEFSGDVVSSEEGSLEWCNIEDSFGKDGASDFYLRISPFIFKTDKSFLGSISLNKNGEIKSVTIL